MVRAVRYVRDGDKSVTYRYDNDNQIFYRAGDEGKFRSTSFESIGDFHASGCTLLDNGNVLFVGGGTYPVGSDRVMEHDVAHNVFTARAGVDVRLRDVQGIKLPDGRVLTAGGWFSSNDGGDMCTHGRNKQIRIYDPRTDAWALAGEVTECVNQMYLTPDGRVVMCGSCLWYYDVDEGVATPILRTRSYTKILGINKYGIITYRTDDYDNIENDHLGIESEWWVASWAEKIHACFGHHVRRGVTAIILTLHRAGVERGHIQLMLERMTADRLQQIHLTTVKLRSRRAPGILATSHTQLVAGP